MRRKAKWICVALACSMVLQSAGCGYKAPEGQGQSVEATTESSQDGGAASHDDTVESSEEIKAGETPDEGHKINDNGVQISDFYEFVNASWIAEQNAQSGGYRGEAESTSDKVLERLTDILESADLDQLSPEDDFYKTVYVYRQMINPEAREKYGYKTIKAYLDKIDGVKNMKQLYDLYGNEEYEFCNKLFDYEIIADGYEYAFPSIAPRRLLYGRNLDDEVCAVMKEMLIKVGYSEKRAEEILKNVKEVDGMIEKVGGEGTWDERLVYVGEEQLQAAGVEFPVLDILDSLHANNEWKELILSENLFPFWKEVYVPENLQKLKDHMILSGLMNMAIFGNDDLQREFFKVTHYMEEGQERSDQEYFTAFLCNYANDVLADRYCAEYLDGTIIPIATEMGKDVCKGARDIIGEKQKLTIDGEKLLKGKVFGMKISYGRNLNPYDLSEVTLSEDPVKNFIALTVNSASNMKKFITEFRSKKRTIADALATNAFYQRSNNIVCVGAGTLSMDSVQEGSKYEEKLATLGFLIAHEVSHAFGESAINMDEKGYYYDWMRDDEREDYAQKMDRIRNFFDGKETMYGKTINGSSVANETFADLTGIRICLNLLKEKEDADYDLFFRTYARMNARQAVSEEDYNALYKIHLPAKDRVNYVLGMFDEFYEVYDMDEESPYYVKPEERIHGFE